MFVCIYVCLSVLEYDIPGSNYTFYSLFAPPDIVIYNSERVTLVESTVPFDDRMTDAKQRKLGKYEDLIGEIAARSSKAILHTIQVGAHGS